MCCPISKKIIISRHMTFNKKAMLKVESSSSDENKRINKEYQTQSKSFTVTVHRSSKGVSDDIVVDEDSIDSSIEDQTQSGASSDTRPAR